MMIRRFASAILTTAVQHSSPEVHEWGNAMLREMDFIENDWAALLWAIGSVMALLKGLAVPMGNPFDIRRKAPGLEKETRRRTVMAYVVCFVAFVTFGWFTFIVPNLIQRSGSGLIVASILFFGYQVPLAWKRNPEGSEYFGSHQFLSY